MKIEFYDNFNEINAGYTVYYLGETVEQNKNVHNFCKILISLWNDYQIENDNKTKNVFFQSFFMNKPKHQYTFCKIHDQLSIISNDEQYFASISDKIHIFFDYKEQKKPIIENIFDVMEASICIQNNNSEYIDFTSDNNEKMQFNFNSIGITIINEMNYDLIINVNIIPLIEEFTFTIPAFTKQFGTMYENYCVIKQIKI